MRLVQQLHVDETGGRHEQTFPSTPSFPVIQTRSQTKRDTGSFSPRPRWVIPSSHRFLSKKIRPHKVRTRKGAAAITHINTIITGYRVVTLLDCCSNPPPIMHPHGANPTLKQHMDIIVQKPWLVQYSSIRDLGLYKWRFFIYLNIYLIYWSRAKRNFGQLVCNTIRDFDNKVDFENILSHHKEQAELPDGGGVNKDVCTLELYEHQSAPAFLLYTQQRRQTTHCQCSDPAVHEDAGAYSTGLVPQHMVKIYPPTPVQETLLFPSGFLLPHYKDYCKHVITVCCPAHQDSRSSFPLADWKLICSVCTFAIKKKTWIKYIKKLVFFSSCPCCVMAASKYAAYMQESLYPWRYLPTSIFDHLIINDVIVSGLQEWAGSSRRL